MSGASNNQPKQVDFHWLESVLKAKKKGKALMACCPAHEDRTPSLQISKDPAGHIILKCYSGCTTEAICNKIGIKVKDLFKPKERPFRGQTNGKKSKPKDKLGTLSRVYNYVDESGGLLFQTCRYEDPKDFRQRRPDPGRKGEYVYNLDGVRRILYRLPELIKADKSEWVFIPEGEKDVDNLRDRFGLIATTNPQGGGPNKWLDDYNPFLQDRKVVLIADNDEPGRAHVQEIAHTLKHHRISPVVKILYMIGDTDGIIIPPKGDISNWIEGGGTKERLLRIVEGLSDWKPSPTKPKEVIPTHDADFIVDEHGLIAISEGEVTKICPPLYIVANTRNVKNSEWGKLLRFFDPDGVEHTWVMPLSLLEGSAGQGYREYLHSEGLVIRPGVKPRQFLDAYLRIDKKERARCVDKVGWYENSYIFPDATVGEPNGDRIYLQAYSGPHHLLQVKGTVEDWKSRISQYAIGNTRMVFVIAMAFGGALLTPLNCETGGFHLWSQTSKGKTTLEYIAGSTWGGGGIKGYLKKWRSTSNALEAVAEYHNDGFLCLDEIREVDAKELGAIVYMLGNGQGKLRSSASGGLRKIIEWKNMILSTGEMTIEDYMATYAQKSYGGQEVRLVNLYAESDRGLGVFDTLHGFDDGEAFSKHLVEASIETYGAPIRSFIDQIINGKQIEKVKLEWRTFKREFQDYTETRGLASEVGRVFERFALVAYAGELATRLNITGWPQGEARTAAHTLFMEWIQARGTLGSTAKLEAIKRVKRFIESFPNRFQRIKLKNTDDTLDDTEQWQDERNAPNARVGFIKPERDRTIAAYHFLPEQFREDVCAGMELRLVLDALKEKGYLIHQAGRNESLLRIPEKEKPIRVYSIKSSILE